MVSGAGWDNSGEAKLAWYNYSFTCDSDSISIDCNCNNISHSK